jgi:preprotein translocase subunit SecG
MLHALFGLLMLVTSVFLILLVLVQRGRGGGLAGALGGMGGQSAFGAKAGDTFTKITIWAATFWILLCMASVVLLNRPERKLNPGGEAISAPSTPGDDAGDGATDEEEAEGGAAATTSDDAATGAGGASATTTGATDAPATGTTEP